MALPPIISNFPLFKLFRKDGAANVPKKQAANTARTSAPQDIVNVAKSEKLASAKKLTEKEVPAVLSETKDVLAKTGYSLGLDPKFS